MKANKKTLMAFKAFLENDSCTDVDELIDDLCHETNMLKLAEMGDMTLASDECGVEWDSKTICTLYEFLEKFIEVYTAKLCNALDSFSGEDIDAYLEE
jgi:hypothetical protein